MKKNLLAEATRALRETEAMSELEAHATRARVMSGLHQTRVRRRTRYAYLLPIAATFVAASAWGAASGKAQLVWASIERITHGAPAPTVAARLGNIAVAPAPLAMAPVAPLPDPEASSTPSAALPPPSSASLPHPPAASTPASAIAQKGAALYATPITPEEAADPTLALYRVAHTAHFVDHDPARALIAWDAYLAAAPNGAFAPEAQYNRALSLVRLGRNAEARSALGPFANGAYGGYRQAEASALLARIDP
jgi:hypothetical protein